MTAPQVALNPEQQAALEIARALCVAGIPIFVAAPDASKKIGFALPDGWQQTAPDPAVVDRWRPGMALCAVMGNGLDLLDFDPRNGGDPSALNGSTPRIYGVATTPSGGLHLFIASLGVGSRDNIYPGIDVKGGQVDGSGRGFAFLAPTTRVSKTTGELALYRWVQPPDLTRLARESTQDRSGTTLANRIRELKASTGMTKLGQDGPDWYREFLLAREPQSAPAAERAITEKLAEVAGWRVEVGEGFRTVLLRAALTLGGYVGGGYLDEAVARERLEQAIGEVWGTPDNDDLLWIEQGLTDGQAQPFPVYTAADELAFAAAELGADQERAAGGDAPGEPPWNVYQVVGTHPFDPVHAGTDQELAEMVAARMYPALRFGVDSGTWLIRGPKVWVEREDMSSWAVSTVARLMPLGQTPVPKEVSERTEMHWQAVRRAKFLDSAGAGKVERKFRSIVRNADHPAGIEVATLDTDPEVLWAGGLPYDLRASSDEPVLATIDPATPHLRTALCSPTTVDTPHWNRFVATVWPDPDLRTWALRVLAISLAGYPDAALPVLYGPERTGKTSLVQLIVAVLGSYAHAADPRLLAGADNAHASVVYALKGRRLSFIDEGPRRGHLASERLKQLTGGGALTGNAMRSNPITFDPTHTLVMTTNDEPPVTDPALRARMRIIPCEADQEAVRAARKAITAAVWRTEAPGVLAALMRECAAWLVDQDSAATAAAPLRVRGAVAEMAAAQDPVREWVEMCTVPADPGTSGRDLYRAFRAWHESQPIYRKANPPTETMFGRILTECGYPAIPNQGPRRNQNYRLLSVMFGGQIPPPGIQPSGVAVQGVAPVVADGSEITPSAPQNPSSTPVFSYFAEGADGSHSSIEDKNTTHTDISPKWSTPESYTRENGDSTAGVSAPVGSNGPSPATMPDAESVARGSAPADQSNAEVTENDLRVSDQQFYGEDLSNSPGQTASDLQEQAQTAESSPSVREPTNSEVAARAYQGGPDKKLTKAEARAQLKAEARLAAIRETSGEVLELPAVATRTGVVLPLTVAEADRAVAEAVRRSGALTVDVETSGYPVGHEHYELRSVQLGDEDAAVVLHPTTHAELIRKHLAEAPRLHAHSATADLSPLAHAGLIDAEASWARMYDTVIPAKLADPASTGSDPGLKQLADVVLKDAAVAPAAEEARKAVFKAGRWLEKTQIDTPLERSGWAQIDTGCTTMIRYAASDVLDTAALARRLPSIPSEVLERERLVQRMTARVTHRGVCIDAEHVRRLTEQHQSARAQAAERVRVFGVDNPGSNPQVAQKAAELGAELPRTKAGALSVAEGAIEPLRRAEGALGAFVSAVLDYRHHDTVLGTFLAPYAQLCVRGDGRARPTVYTLGTDTGRMSCVRPNLQQLPREGGVRACVIADPGQLMISADFSGVEIRVAAALSQDPTLTRIIAEGRDLHAEIALQVFGADPVATAKTGVPTAAKAHRYTAKRIVFGRLYGGGIATLARQGGCDEVTAQRAVDTLDQITPVLSAWSAGVREGVKQGRVTFTSYSGRIIHFPREYPHKAPNYAIQGTARELLVDAFIRWSQTRWGSATILPVHDELDAFVPAEDAEEATQVLVQCMKSELGGVQIVAEPEKPSPFWLDSV